LYRLFDSKLSGNSWKVRILLRQLGLPFERVTLDLAKGATADPVFRSRSRFARVPVLELEDGRTVVESGAILLYLAEGSPFLPDGRYFRAEVGSWLFFEQADLLRPLGLPRFYHLIGKAAEMERRIGEFHEVGYAALAKLEQGLSGRDWLVGARYSIADLGVFPYVEMAPLGGYDMGRFPAIAAWLGRVKAVSDWVPLVEEA
jgi:glutathione S-transferase